MSHIRCRGQGVACGKPSMKFKCRWCKRWVCGSCEGTHNDRDPIGNRLCDPCWCARARRLTPQFAARVGIHIEAVQ